MADGPRAGTRESSPTERARKVSRHLASESKLAPLTSEFWVFAVVCVAVLLARLLSGGDYGAPNADQVWLYVTILTSAYLLSRGLAKFGVQREETGPGAGSQRSLGERGVRPSTASLRRREMALAESDPGSGDDTPPAASSEGTFESRGPGL